MESISKIVISEVNITLYVKKSVAKPYSSLLNVKVRVLATKVYYK